jgi:hypothetical protein
LHSKRLRESADPAEVDRNAAQLALTGIAEFFVGSIKETKMTPGIGNVAWNKPHLKPLLAA